MVLFFEEEIVMVDKKIVLNIILVVVIGGKIIVLFLGEVKGILVDEVLVKNLFECGCVEFVFVDGSEIVDDESESKVKVEVKVKVGDKK